MSLIFFIFFHISCAEYKDMIKQTAEKYDVDPNLAIAIATVESNINPNAVGALGEIGIFQLRPEYHKVKSGNVKDNIIVGIKYLKEVKTLCIDKYGDAWFICFNTGPYKQITVDPVEFSYYKKVMKIYDQRRGN